MDKYLLYLLLMTVFAGILVGKIQSSNVSSVNDQNFDQILAENGPCYLAPGVDGMSYGIDITRFSTVSLDSDHGFARQILNYSCGETRWPLNENNDIEYFMPNEFLLFEKKPEKLIEEFTHVHRSIGDYKLSLSKKVSVAVQLPEAVSVKASNYKSFQAEYYTSSSTTVHELTSVTTVGILTVKDGIDLPLTDEFIKALNKLKPNFIDDQKNYCKFIETYGTHYFTQATTGGRLYQHTTLDQQYSFYKTDFELKKSAEAEFVANFSSEAGVKGGTFNSEFHSTSVVETRAFGGGPDALMSNLKTTLNYSSSQITKRLGSNDFDVHRFGAGLIKNPWLISGSFQPIETLIKSDKSYQVKIASQVYQLTVLYYVFEEKYYKAFEKFQYLVKKNSDDFYKIAKWYFYDEELKHYFLSHTMDSVNEKRLFYEYPRIFSDNLKAMDNLATINNIKNHIDEFNSYMNAKIAASVVCVITGVPPTVCLVERLNQIAALEEEYESVGIISQTDADNLLKKVLDFKENHILIHHKGTPCCYES